MILEMDAGNSRIKWRFRAGNGVVWQRGAAAGLEELATQLPQLSPPGRVRVASVRDREFTRGLEQLLAERWQIRPEFAQVTASCAGVSNGYHQPTALGVDRWLAIVAAFNRWQRTCCVVDCGSAVTVDWVDDRGRHQGGYIVPGLRLMQDSLHRRTELRFADREPVAAAEPGRTTEEAVTHGVVAMMTTWLGKLAERQMPDAPVLLLTGGDAGRLEPHLRGQGGGWAVVPELVLDGLALAVP